MKSEIPLNPPLLRGRLKIPLDDTVRRGKLISSTYIKASSSPLFKGGPGGICRNAFTLIEVMVVMAIISILAGMLVPSVWRFWESEEIATTRQRMKDLKIAMVGDKTLVQNGIRTHYGFVGDNGELPFGNSTSAGGMSYLVTKPTGWYPNWNGPYLTGFTSEWSKDAWGRTFKYTLSKDAYDRYMTAEIRSAGPNGAFGDSDDIVDPDVQISEVEITAENKILTNIPQNTGSIKSLKLIVSFNDPTDSSGVYTKPSDCVNFQVFENTTTLPISPKKLPIGGVNIVLNRYTAVDCPDLKLNSSSNYRYYVNSNINSIKLNNPINNP